MKRNERLLKNDRDKFFTVEQAKILTGFSRSQLLTWEENGIVVPERRTKIFYNWKQIVFLRILYDLRKDWTFKELEFVFKIFMSPEDLEKFVNWVQDSVAVILAIENDGFPFVRVFTTLDLENKSSNEKFQKAIENILNGVKIDYEYALAIIHNVASDTLEQDSLTRFSFQRRTLLVIPEIIREIHKSAEKLQVRNFDQKVG